MPKYPDHLTAKLRYAMPPKFTTAQFKERAIEEGIMPDEAQKMLSYMIKRGFIVREKVGHYRKDKRYIDEV